MQFLKVIKLQILKQVAEIKGADVRTIKLNRFLPTTIVTDFFIGQFIVSPLVTMCWRSAWMLGDILFDKLVFPGQKNRGIILSLVSGICLTILLRFVILVPSMLSSIPSVLYFILSRTFTVIYFCCYMVLWRGWWSLLVKLDGPKLLILCVGICSLFVSGTLPTNVGPPLAISHDTRLVKETLKNIHAVK